MTDSAIQTVPLFGSAYYLRVQFGDSDLNLEPQHIGKFEISLDLNKFLPMLRMKILDSQGLLSHLVPFDNSSNKIRVTLGQSMNVKDPEKHLAEFNFAVYRRFPSSESWYDVECLLNVDNLFSPTYCRSFNQSVQATIMELANEIGMDSAELSVSLNFSKNIIQPKWTNAQLLNYLKYNLIGKGDDGCFYSFVKINGLNPVLVFKNLSDFVRSHVKYKFMVGGEYHVESEEKEQVDYYPVFKYKIFDSYKVFGIFGAAEKTYEYFDWSNSEFVSSSHPVSDYPSLTEYHLIDRNDPLTDVKTFYGCSNDFTSDFKGRVVAAHFRGVTSLINIWIATQGLEDISPGDIVLLEFAIPKMLDNELGMQHRGYWMVEKVVHTLGMSYMTKLLLTRNGINTTAKTSLLKALKIKKND